MCVSWYIFLPNFIAVHYLKDQSSVEGSGNSNKRLRSLSQGEKTADHGAPPSAASDAHSKEDDDVEQENSKRKVMLKFTLDGHALFSCSGGSLQMKLKAVRFYICLAICFE